MTRLSIAQSAYAERCSMDAAIADYRRTRSRKRSAIVALLVAAILGLVLLAPSMFAQQTPLLNGANISNDAVKINRDIATLFARHSYSGTFPSRLCTAFSVGNVHYRVLYPKPPIAYVCDGTEWASVTKYLAIPIDPSSACEVGERSIDTQYTYTCVATNTWRRAPHSSWPEATGTGILGLNGLTVATQSFGIATTGTDFNILSSSGVHTFYAPTIGTGVSRGLLNIADWNEFKAKQAAITGAPSMWPTFGSAAFSAASAFEVPLGVSPPVTRSGNTFGLDQNALTIGNSSTLGGLLVSSHRTAADLALAATPTNTVNTIVRRDVLGDIAVRNVVGDLIGNADTASNPLDPSSFKTSLAIAPADIVNDNNVLTTTAEVVTTGSTFTPATRTRRVYVDPASTLPTLTITLPPTPVDGDQLLIMFGGTLVAGNQVVTTLSVVPNSGQSILEFNSAVVATAGDVIQYEYRASATRWHRIQ